MKWMEIAHAEMGVAEDKTEGSNDRILQYARAAGYTPRKGDGDPWCGNFMAYVMAEAGYGLPAQPWRARAWEGWGRSVGVQRGAVAIVPRGKNPKQGHVFLIDRVDGEWVYGLGGNQNDSVSIAKFRRDRIESCRWPQEAPAPAVAAIATAAKTGGTSRTITGVLMAALGTMMQYLEGAVTVLMDAAAKVTEWAPAESFLYTIGGNAKSIGFGLAAAGLTLALFRRLEAGVKAKEG
jgi:uncharacterized protein (TIGR02594 family)